MAKIYPSDIDLETLRRDPKHRAEVLVLDELNKNTEKTKDWVVYYSYEFRSDHTKAAIYDPNHEPKLYREIDFLVLIPNLGIFVMEIKGGYIKRRDGLLFSVSRGGEEHLIDPYAQAKSNYYELAKKLGTKDDGDELKRFVGGGLVCFPDVSRVDGDTPMESDGADTLFSSENIVQFLYRASRALKEQFQSKREPTKEEVAQIEKRLNGADFEYTLSLKDYIKSANLSFNQLTEEQTTVFQGLLMNKRCLITGGAGTGKTVLAQFLFQRLLEEKKSVLYFTFNEPIAEKINSSLPADSKCKCYPVYNYLLQLYKNGGGDESLVPEGFTERVKFLVSQDLWVPDVLNLQ